MNKLGPSAGRRAKWSFAAWLICCAAVARISRAADSGIVLANGVYNAIVNPISLQVTLQSPQGGPFLVSMAQTNLGRIDNLETTTSNVSWDLIDRAVHVNARLQSDGLLVHVLAENEGNFTFPVMSGANPAKGWIVPMFEGVYVPSGDAQWSAFLTNYGPMDTTADLPLPFLGLDCGDFTATCIITNAFNNKLRFVPAPDGALAAALTHQFTRNHPVKEYAVFFQLGGNSPVEPARLYRKWLVDRGQFVSLADKVKKIPDVAKLAGAAQVYLWGGEIIDRTDVISWPQFVRDLQALGSAPDFTPGKRIWAMMHGDARKAVADLSHAEFFDRYNENKIADDLSRILLKRDFYDESFWPDGVPDATDAAMLKTNRVGLTLAQLRRINSRLLDGAFIKALKPPETWGNGLSPKMINRLALAGFDRLWLGSASWDEFVERPETIEAAKKQGYLIGPYDSYNSVHAPGETDTWETAQFDEQLYENGAIVDADGTNRRGFKQKGHLLSPEAARPYLEKRVTRLTKLFNANSWFVDCDGFGQYYDDYSEEHPATQQSDMLARISRMMWMRDAFGMVIGTEGCSAGVASTVHFAQGVLTPVIGWGDEDMADKKSKYYVGKYYPPDGPEVFFKPVPLKEEYRRVYYEPRFRLPLFETVFHDSVVATHHWSFGSLKAKDEVGTMELLELLYGVPPLYHLNLEEFQRRGTLMQRHYKFFSPLHREIFYLPMTDFKWLNDDRSAQETTFSDEVSLIANFGKDDFQWHDHDIPAQSILAIWKATGKTMQYSVETEPAKQR